MDTVISIGRKQIEPFAVIKEKNWITSKDLSKMMENSQDNILELITDRGFTHNIHSFMEWNDYISFFYMSNRERFFVLYNKENGITRTTKLLINDIGYDMPWLVNKFACSDDNGLYEIIGMFSIDRYMERIKIDNPLKKDVDKYEQLNNLPQDTNPILFYYEFK